MATPYFQQRHKSVASTQDVAREALDHLPVLVLAQAQTEGRGRGGDHWLNADRALAASLAFRAEPGDVRPFSLLAGVAVARVAVGAGLKWPNDVLIDSDKAGGILVERTSDVVVIGLGLNLWWPAAPAGMTGLSVDDPGEDHHVRVGALWGAEMMGLIDGEGWPVDEYRGLCVTVGRDVTWQPDGSGHAVDVAGDGGLIVDRDGTQEVVYSGAVSLVRDA